MIELDMIKNNKNIFQTLLKHHWIKITNAYQKFVGYLNFMKHQLRLDI